jgi:hypothetical protein
VTAQMEETTYSLSGDDDEVRLLLMVMMRWEPQWKHRSMRQQATTEDFSDCTKILWSDLTTKTPPTEQWEERGGVLSHTSQVKKWGGQEIASQCDAMDTRGWI